MGGHFVVGAAWVIYDAVDVPAIPADATVILAYIDGGYITYQAVRDRFPNALILTITTTGWNSADICDVESGDATPAIAAAGVRDGLFRTVYSAWSNKGALDSLISGAWHWFAADPTGHLHLAPGSVATQWAWPGLGSPGNYDISTTDGVWPNTPVPPTPTPPPPQEATMAVSPTIQFKPNQIDVFQVLNGTLYHKYQVDEIWHGEVVAGPLGGKSTVQVTLVDQVPQVTTIGGAVQVNTENTAGYVMQFAQASTSGTWGAAQLP